ncbi:MAG: glycosyltransferase, partial [Burkholderiales bacterium]|nr:glycosyltransferase [Opitutaceae bacterium]
NETTCPALAAAQAALGAKVCLATLTPPAGSPPTFDIRHSSLVIRDFPPTPGPLGSTFCFSPGLAAFLRATPARAIHAHGVWLRPLHHAAQSARLHRAPLILAPRGMLEPWALAHHVWKKRLAAAFIQPRALAAVTGWHATSQQEADHFRTLPAWLRPPEIINHKSQIINKPAPSCVAPNGIAPPDPASAAPARAAWLAAYPKLHDTRVALFYGRLHRKKRVAELIALWRSRPRPGWTLLVAGIPGDYTIADLAALAGADSASPIVVADGGPLPQPYALADLFLLPSHSENFGQAVAEALAAGVPALVTDTLPWRELDAVSAGRCVSWTDYPAALDALLALPPPALAALGASGRTWVLDRFTWTASARRLLDFYPTLSPSPP